MSDDEKMVAEQPKRAKMFSPREMGIITEFMQVNLSMLKASHSQGGPGAAQKVSNLWESLTGEVNACGQGPRTVKQVKEKWRNMVKIAKTDVTAERNSGRVTGGGPAAPAMSQTSQAVAGLFKNSASFHGVCSDAETAINETGIDDTFLSFDPLTSVDYDTPLAENTAREFGSLDGNGSLSSMVPEDTTPSNPEGANSDNIQSNVLYTARPVRTEDSQNRVRGQKRSLKEVQMDYYEKQSAVSDAQVHCYLKFAKLAEVLIEKFK